MTAENNRKYIAEAWIEEDIDFKKSFLKSLLEEVQGHSDTDPKFNADMVDGWHKSDIQAAIDEGKEDFIKNFNIGYTEFRNKDVMQYFLGFEAIKLYNEDAEISDEDLKTLPWRDGIIGDEEGETIPNLHEVFAELYNLTYINDEDDEDYFGLTNQEIFIKFKKYVQEIDKTLANISSSLEGKINEDGTLNADTVNGLRFFIYTQEQYDDLKESAETNEDDYKKLNSIHNVFIIKSREDIVNGGYEDGIYYENPDTAVINKYYEFRVAEIYDEEEEKNIKYLQYRHKDESYSFKLCPNEECGFKNLEEEDSCQKCGTSLEEVDVTTYDGWKTMCKAGDFVDFEEVESILINILENNENYIINQKPFSNALKNLNNEDVLNNPLTNYNKDTFITGAYSDYENTSNNTPIDIIKNNGFNFLNLEPLKDDLITEINNVSGALNTYKDLVGKTKEEGYLKDISNDVLATNQRIDSLRGTSESNLGSIETLLNGVNSRLKTVEGSLSDFLEQVEWKTETVSYGQYGNNVLIYNEALKIAYFHFSFRHYTLGDESDDWYLPCKSGTKVNKKRDLYPNSYTKAKPFHSIGVINIVHPNDTWVQIDTEGQLWVRTTRTKKTDFYCRGSVFYQYSELRDD